MPSLPPPRTTELHYDGAWHDISGSMRESAPVTITRGVGAEGNQPSPTTASAVLDNRSGDYSPRNPTSALHGKIGRNTPWRFSVAAGGPWAELTSTNASLSTPGTAMTVLGDLDVRVDITEGRMLGVQHTVGRWRTADNQRSWAMSINWDGKVILRWSVAGTAGTTYVVTSTAVAGLSTGDRATLRATLDINNGDGGHTVSFYRGPTLSGPWTPVGDPVSEAGTTSIWPGNAVLELGAVPDVAWQSLNGKIHGMQLRTGINGPLVVDLNIAASGTPGASSLTDGTGRVWTVRSSAKLSNQHVRMVGEVPAWPPSRDLSGADRTVAITPAGIMRRLSAGNKPLASALRRFIVGNSAAIDSWPLTEGDQAQWGASLLGGARMLPVEGSEALLQWGKGDIGDWLEPVTAITRETEGAITVDVPFAADAATGWAVDMVRAGSGVDTGLVITDWGAGTTASPRTQWILVTELGGLWPDSVRLMRFTQVGDDLSSELVTVVTGTGIHDGRPHHLRLQTLSSGGYTDWWISVDGRLIDIGVMPAVFQPPRTLRYEWNETGSTDTTDLSLGYLTYWGADAPDAMAVYEAYQGFAGETAGARALRVAAEQGVPLTVVGDPAVSTPMGIQRPGRMLDILTGIARTDLGYVLERRDALSLVYRGRDTLYNQPPVAVLNWPDGVIGAPFAPTDDDKNTRNDVTVRRDGGVESTAVLAEGPMSVQDPPDGIGRYDQAHTLSLARDDQATDHAWWRLHLGTVDGLRYTKVTVDLANPRAHAMISDLYRADVGDILRLTNLPADYGGGSTDLLIRGYTEEISATRWSITFTCDPGEPWQVGIVEDPVTGRADTDGSELMTATGAAATSLVVMTPQTAGGVPIWTSDSAQYPFDLMLGGEVVTATGCADLARDTFTRTVTGGWGTSSDGHPWTGTGGAPEDRSVSSSRGVINLGGSQTALRVQTVAETVTDGDVLCAVSVSAAAAGASLMPMILLRYVDGGAHYRIRVDFTTAGAVRLSLTRTFSQIDGVAETGLSYVAGNVFRVRVRMLGQRVLARIWPNGAPEPDLWHLDRTVTTDPIPAGLVGVGAYALSGNSNAGVECRFDDFAVENPQRFSVVRAVNGISKAHTAGTAVSLAHPLRAAL